MEDLKAINVIIAELDEELSKLMLEKEIQSFKRAGTMFYITSKLQASEDGERREMQWDRFSPDTNQSVPFGQQAVVHGAVTAAMGSGDGTVL